MRGEDTGPEKPANLPDLTVWRRSRMRDASEDDAGRMLDLAGFADEFLDLDDRERVAEWLAGDPLAAADVAAARALGALTEPPEAAPASVIARACALVPSNEPPRGLVIPFKINRREIQELRSVAGWGILVAAMVVAGWLGFTLGMDASLSVSLAQFDPAGDEGFLRELLDPSTGFNSDPTEGAQT